MFPNSNFPSTLVEIFTSRQHCLQLCFELENCASNSLAEKKLRNTIHFKIKFTWKHNYQGWKHHFNFQVNRDISKFKYVSKLCFKVYYYPNIWSILNNSIFHSDTDFGVMDEWNIFLQNLFKKDALVRPLSQRSRYFVLHLDRIMEPR